MICFGGVNVLHKLGHNTIAVAIVILFGAILFYTGTDGFNAFTTRSANEFKLMQSKLALPAVTLEDSQGREFRLDQFAKGKYVFLSFMYTSCGTVCPEIEMNMAKVYQLIPDMYINKEIVFLSISFDPVKDDPKILDQYRTYFGSDGETWRMARITDPTELNLLLEKLKVTVIPDGKGDFTHSTPFYLVGKDGRLLKVMDYTKVDEAADTIVSYLDEK